MGMINKIPFGFLGMLQSKTGGTNPSQTTDVVAPVIPMDGFYHAGNLGRRFATMVAPIANNFIDIDVPNDETWVLYGVAFDQGGGLVNSNREIRVSLVDLPSNPAVGAGEFFLFVSGPMLTGPGIVLNQRSFMLPKPMTLNPGVGIRFFINNITGAQDNVNCYALAAIFEN